VALTLLTVRQLQVPLLALMLLGGCASKARRVVRDRTIASGLGPAGLFPWRLRRPFMVMMYVLELTLGLALIATAGRPGAGAPATVTRAGTALFFLVAIGTLYEVRQHRPEAGCGCFGDLSDTPIGLRTIARACLLCLAAVASIGAPPLRMASSTREAGFFVCVLGLELALIAVLSPEVAEIGVRLGYSEPCELRRLPVTRTLASLKASAQWRRHAAQITGDGPADIWREGCWRFVVFPGVADGQPADIVFAVYLQPRRPPIRVAVLPASRAV
jgi:Methylamine utilisation protein MauE